MKYGNAKKINNMKRPSLNYLNIKLLIMYYYFIFLQKVYFAMMNI